MTLKSMPSRHITLNLSPLLVDAVDSVRKLEGMTRSAYVSMTLLHFNKVRRAAGLEAEGNWTPDPDDGKAAAEGVHYGASTCSGSTCSTGGYRN